jgi:DNA-directed RNA polymerase specialized sigma24 family protein
LEEAKLAERAREGDTATYERLVPMHQAVAFRAAYLVTRDAPEAEDATQEAFVKAYRALDGSGRAPPSDPGCSPSSPTRPGTAAGRRDAGRT